MFRGDGMRFLCKRRAHEQGGNSERGHTNFVPIDFIIILSCSASPRPENPLLLCDAQE